MEGFSLALTKRTKTHNHNNSNKRQINAKQNPSPSQSEQMLPKDKPNQTKTTTPQMLVRSQRKGSVCVCLCLVEEEYTVTADVQSNKQHKGPQKPAAEATMPSAISHPATGISPKGRCIGQCCSGQLRGRACMREKMGGYVLGPCTRHTTHYVLIRHKEVKLSFLITCWDQEMKSSSTGMEAKKMEALSPEGQEQRRLESTEACRVRDRTGVP